MTPITRIHTSDALLLEHIIIKTLSHSSLNTDQSHPNKKQPNPNTTLAKKRNATTQANQHANTNELNCCSRHHTAQDDDHNERYHNHDYQNYPMTQPTPTSFDYHPYSKHNSTHQSTSQPSQAQTTQTTTTYTTPTALHPSYTTTNQQHYNPYSST